MNRPSGSSPGTLPQAAPEPLPEAFPEHASISTRSGFQAALRTAFSAAAEHGCGELWLCDAGFSDWPLNDVAVIADLTRWAAAHRRLTVLARHFDEFPRRHARWVAWRRTWSHIVECHCNAELDAARMPTLLLAPGLMTVRLFDPVRWRGQVSRRPGDALQARELLDAVLQRSTEAFPVTSLGLQG